jgi:signal transduction histidine kinase
MNSILLNFGRPQNMREIQLVEFIEEIASQAHETEKNLEIVINSHSEEGNLKIMAGSLLILVFMNLFRNASQHAGPNPIVDVKLSRESEKAVIFVSDNGPGIPKNLQNNLFLRGTSTKGEIGGLGLYLCREIMNGYNGSIEFIDSKEGVGATFRLEIPLI